METKKLGEIAEIIGGQITSRLEKKVIDDLFETPTDSDKSSVKLKAQVLMPKAISNAFVDKSSLPTITCEKDSKESVDAPDLTFFVDESKITKADTLVLKLSTPYDACVITKDDENLIVPSFCASLKITDNDVDLLYLLAFLNSNLYQNQIKKIVAGSAIALISVGTVKEINVPIPPKAEQEKIGKNFIGTMKKLNLINKITTLEIEKINAVFNGMEG